MNEFVSVWATKEGYIGASITGAVPIRPHSTIPAFRNGSDSTQDWKVSTGGFASAAANIAAAGVAAAAAAVPKNSAAAATAAT